MLAHGKAMQVIKSYGDDVQGGIANIIYHIEPYRDCDMKAVENANKVNRLFMDPILKGEYPDLKKLFVPDSKIIKTGDMKIISHPTDFVGLNIYTRAFVRNSILPTGFMPVKASYPEVEHSSMGWEVYPKAMYDSLKWVSENYNNPIIYITENGASFEDKLEGNRVVDNYRINFLEKYINNMEKAKDEGVNVRGYFVWSLLDNFEWGFGYTKKYGLVHVDPKTGNRTLKDSAIWYGNMCKQKLAES
jgi:beta-glucosidase